MDGVRSSDACRRRTDGWKRYIYCACPRLDHRRVVPVRGTATLAFDFAAGTLGGHFDPTHYDLLLFGGNGQSLGRYDFVNPVYSAGSPIFSGQLTKAGTTEMGAFDGQFTGPSAQELMARWTITNGGNPTMFGVWVGSK